jgi:hypothetical protein
MCFFHLWLSRYIKYRLHNKGRRVFGPVKEINCVQRKRFGIRTFFIQKNFQAESLSYYFYVLKIYLFNRQHIKNW